LGFLVPIRTRAAPDLEVPEAFSRLRDLVYNLWWSWSPLAHVVFHRMAPATWQHYRNPIDVLIDLSPERWNALQNDDEFTRSYQALIERFDRYVEPAEPTWFEQYRAGWSGAPFAYFSTEYGWHECLQVYSGGLGVLSGDHCKSASDLGLPFIGVGLMYKRGYFRQSIDAEGLQQHTYPDYDLQRVPLLPVLDASGRELHVPVELRERSVYVRVWNARVGRVPVLLLDSDLPINHPSDRPITSTLYVRGREMRLCQEILLGMGGVRVLAALGIAPAAWHVNEGHSTLLVLERLREEMGREGAEFGEALRRVRRTTVFTTHTPVPAGNERFDIELMRTYLGGFCQRHRIELERLLDLGRTESDPGQFNLTALGLRASVRSNGVSQLHGQVANRMWGSLIEQAQLPAIEAVTNGVHPPTWVGPEMGEVLERRFKSAPEEASAEQFAAAVQQIPDWELWTAHLAQKRRLISLVREKTLEQFARHGRSPEELRGVDHLLDPDTLTVGFARRFATYKRADLILREAERLRSIVASAERPVQLIFAGKAHPADRPGQDLVRRICQAALAPELAGRIVFVENYDLRLGRHLVQGVDLWLNTPRRPHEASGTSGMKAAVNGVLNCSILDGWWCEGYDASHGWALGQDGEGKDEEAQDREDSDALYRVLAEQIVPAFYDHNEHGLPAAWIRRMKAAIGLLTPRFSTRRMVQEYAQRYYMPAARGEL
jgi:glycogen phosphorylase